MVEMKTAGRVDSHSGIWRMLPPPARFRHRTSPMKSPSCRRDIDWFTVERWPSLISSQPRLRYTVNALRVLRYADREWCRLTRVILHLTLLSLSTQKYVLSLRSLGCTVRRGCAGGSEGDLVHEGRGTGYKRTPHSLLPKCVSLSLSLSLSLYIYIYIY